MWRNLAKNALNVVAPPVDEENDDELEEDEEILSQDDDDQSDMYHREDEEEEEERTSGIGFGLVGMLTRALDKEQKNYDVTHVHREDDEEEEVELDQSDEERLAVFDTALDDETPNNLLPTKSKLSTSKNRSESFGSPGSQHEPKRFSFRRETGSMIPSPSPSNKNARTLSLSDHQVQITAPLPQSRSVERAMFRGKSDDLSGHMPPIFNENEPNTSSNHEFPKHENVSEVTRPAKTKWPIPPPPFVERSISQESLDIPQRQRRSQRRENNIPPQDRSTTDSRTMGKEATSETHHKSPTKQRESPLSTERIFPNDDTTHTDVERNHPAESPKNNTSQATNRNSNGDPTKQSPDLFERCRELETKLEMAEHRIVDLQQQAAQYKQEEDQQQVRFQEKEARLLAAAQEEHEAELNQLKQLMTSQMEEIKRVMEEERKTSKQENEKLRQKLVEVTGRLEQAENEYQSDLSRQRSAAWQYQEQQESAVRLATDKLAQTMATLDERNKELDRLKAKIRTLESDMSEHHHGAEEAEEELEELNHENESLRQHVETVEAQCAELRAKLTEVQADSDKISHLKMELRMIKEDRDRERAKNQSVAESSDSNTAQLEYERDAALAEVRDLQQQLDAARADLELSRTDYKRIMTANQNLQIALESFQTEREAELGLLDEQRLQREEATAAAHAAALEATHEAHEARINELQYAAEQEMKKLRDEIKRSEEKVEKFRNENIQMRRSLDEAINRLQTTQEDVIDRTLMKNILLDWLTKTGQKERQQVLELMANVLHFTEYEKAKVHIGDNSHGFGRVVESVAKFPPAKADLEHLEGENVREKWINFLLAETED